MAESGGHYGVGVGEILGVRVGGRGVDVAVGKRVAVPGGVNVIVMVSGNGVGLRSASRRAVASARSSAETAVAGKSKSRRQSL